MVVGSCFAMRPRKIRERYLFFHDEWPVQDERILINHHIAHSLARLGFCCAVLGLCCCCNIYSYLFSLLYGVGILRLPMSYLGSLVVGSKLQGRRRRIKPS